MFVDYAPKGVQFYYVYKSLAHPELHGYVGPVTLEERLMHIREAKRTLGTKIPWLCDNMNNDLKHAIGDANNSEFVLDPEGKIVVMRLWSDPDKLREDLARLVGPVEKPTTVADLDMKVEPPPKTAPTGIVPRLRITEPMRPLKAEPLPSKHPFYVKLRAEADRALLGDGKGKMYLGFHLDPLYGVHWNNRVAPVRYEFSLPEGIRIEPAEGEGPKVEQEADADPREFLLDVDRGDSTEPVTVAFHYYACDEKMCIPVSQQYRIRWEPDPDGGRARRGPPRRPPARMIERIMESDADGDGRISREEAPEMLLRRFDRMDIDGDGYVTRAELEQRMRRGPRGGPPPDLVERIMSADADGDGRVSREEAPERMRQRFDRMDADGDGYVSREEAGQAAERIRRRGGPPRP